MDERKEDPRHERDYLVLFSAVRGLRADIDDLTGEIRELKATIYVDPETKEKGLEAIVDELTKFRIRLDRILDPDYTRQGGLLQQHRILWDEHEMEERQIERETVPRWQFWTAVVVALITGVFALLVTWPDLMAYIDKHNKPTPLEKKIERVRHPRDRYHHYTVNVSSDGSERITSP